MTSISHNSFSCFFLTLHSDTSFFFHLFKFSYFLIKKLLSLNPLIMDVTLLLCEIEPNDEQTPSLSVSNYYLSWDAAKVYLNKYAKAAGFSLCRKRVKTDNGEVRQYTFECIHSDK